MSNRCVAAGFAAGASAVPAGAGEFAVEAGLGCRSPFSVNPGFAA